MFNFTTLVFLFSFYSVMVFKSHSECTINGKDFTLRFKVCFILSWILIIAEIIHLVFIRTSLQFSLLKQSQAGHDTLSLQNQIILSDKLSNMHKLITAVLVFACLTTRFQVQGTVCTKKSKLKAEVAWLTLLSILNLKRMCVLFLIPQRTEILTDQSEDGQSAQTMSRFDLLKL